MADELTGLTVLEAVCQAIFSDSSEFNAPFEVRQLAGASVSWINYRWFLSRGIDITERATRDAIEAWLLNDYAWLVPRPEDPLTAFTGASRTWYADRYGEAGASDHGGSGRAGYWAGYQVKGCGTTPLIGVRSGWLHAHGCMWLEEAIREAVYAELFQAELPHGAVPVIAIIDTHLHAELPPGHVGERRALVVRPAVARVSHLLRAADFQAVHDPNGVHVTDVHRIDKVAHALIRATPAGKTAEFFTELSIKVAEQLAYMDAHRLSVGGLHASSITLDGRVMDFGGARATWDWRRSEMSMSAAEFGCDWKTWISVIRALEVQLRRRGVVLSPSTADAFLTTYWERLGVELAGPWLSCAAGDSELHAKRVLELAKSLFITQQKRTTSYSSGQPREAATISQQLDNVGQVAPESPDRDIMDRLISELVAPDMLRSEQANVRAALSRYFSTRTAVDREGLQQALFADVVPKTPDQDLAPFAIDTVVNHCISVSHRPLPLRSRRYVGATRDATTFAAVFAHEDGVLIQLTASTLGTEAIVFGQRIPSSDLQMKDGHEAHAEVRGSMRSGMIHFSVAGRAYVIAPGFE